MQASYFFFKVVTVINSSHSWTNSGVKVSLNQLVFKHKYLFRYRSVSAYQVLWQGLQTRMEVQAITKRLTQVIWMI